MRRAAIVLLLALVVSPVSPAQADDTVVVPGTSFPAGGTYLSWFGCPGLFEPAAAGPSASVALDEGAPLGSRATRLALPAPGQASGPVSRVAKVSRASWSLWVRPLGGGQGVAHAWYVSAGLDDGEVWSGRADLSATADRWQRIRPAAATYTWARIVAATGEVRERLGPATVPAFVRAHGDGPGYLLAGFGCDGAPFLLDGVAADGTTYDLEGIPVRTTIEASHAEVPPGTEVTLVGRTLDGAGRVTGARLVLEARPAGATEWTRVGTETFPGRGDGAVVATVAPETTTDYRWFQPTTGYADPGWSPVLTVRVGG